MTLLQAASFAVAVLGACLAAYLHYRRHLQRNLEDRSALIERIALEQDSEDLGDAGDIMASLSGRGSMLESEESARDDDTRRHYSRIDSQPPERRLRLAKIKVRRIRRQPSTPPSAQAVATSFVNDMVSFHIKTLMAEMEKKDRRSAKSSMISNVVFFILGVATPIGLKLAFGIG